MLDVHPKPIKVTFPARELHIRMSDPTSEIWIRHRDASTYIVDPQNIRHGHCFRNLTSIIVESWRGTAKILYDYSLDTPPETAPHLDIWTYDREDRLELSIDGESVWGVFRVVDARRIRSNHRQPDSGLNRKTFDWNSQSDHAYRPPPLSESRDAKPIRFRSKRMRSPNRQTDQQNPRGFEELIRYTVCVGPRE